MLIKRVYFSLLDQNRVAGGGICRKRALLTTTSQNCPVVVRITHKAVIGLLGLAIFKAQQGAYAVRSELWNTIQT